MSLPALLDSPPEHGLVNAGQSDQRIHRGGESGSLSESHAKQQGDQVHMGYADGTPVEGSDDNKYCGQNIEIFHGFPLLLQAAEAGQAVSRVWCIEYDAKYFA